MPGTVSSGHLYRIDDYVLHDEERGVDMDEVFITLNERSPFYEQIYGSLGEGVRQSETRSLLHLMLYSVAYAEMLMRGDDEIEAFWDRVRGRVSNFTYKFVSAIQAGDFDSVREDRGDA